MDPDEENDTLGPLVPCGLDPMLTAEILAAKLGDPSAFVSYWEEDEQDIEAATEEEIQNDPVQRTLWAAETGNLEVLQEMLAKDKDLVKAMDRDGYQPLHRASYENHTEAIKVLLGAGADISAETEDGWQPLHSACRWGQTEAASLLLQNGADINARTHGGLTPLHLAAANAETKNILELLLMNAEIDVTLRNKTGELARELCERANPFAYLFDMHSDSINKLSS